MTMKLTLPLIAFLLYHLQDYAQKPQFGTFPAKRNGAAPLFLKIDKNSGNINNGWQFIGTSTIHQHQINNYYFSIFLTMRPGIDTVTLNAFLTTEISKKFKNRDFYPVIQRALKARTYQLQKSKNSDSIIMTLPYGESDFRLPIDFICEAQDGIRRTKRSNLYYYLKTNDSSLFYKDGIPEGYEVATDFSRGVAIIANVWPDTSYRMIDTTGVKSKFAFIRYEDNFGGYPHLFKLMTEDHLFVLASSDMKILTHPFQSIRQLSDNYFEYTRKGEKGILRIDSTGNKIDTSGTRYTDVVCWKHDLVIVKDDTGYKMLDAANDFAVLITHKLPMYVISENKTGMEYALSPPGGNGNDHGYFFFDHRNVIPPEWQSFGHLNSLQCIRANRTDPKTEGSIYTYLDKKGNQVFKNYLWIDDQPDSVNYILVKLKPGCYTFIDENEKRKIKGTYSSLQRFQRDLAFASIGVGNTGYINRAGNYTPLDSTISLLKELAYSPTGDVPGAEIRFSETYDIAIAPRFNMEKAENTYSVIGRHPEWGVLYKGSKKPLFIASSGIPGVATVTDSAGLYLYYKDGKPFIKDTATILLPFQNGYAISRSATGGFNIIDSSGRIYPDYRYNPVSGVINGKYMIVTRSKLKGIIKIIGKEVLLGLQLDDIRFENGIFICSLGDLIFELDGTTDPEGKFFPLLKGDKAAYQRLLTPAS